MTGASRGIGQAIARRLAADGAKVAAVARTARASADGFAGSLEETVALISDEGGEAIGIEADLSASEGLAGIVEQAETAFGRGAQILVNNAAAERHFELTVPLMRREVFLESILVNIWAPWQLMIEALPSMRRQGGGWIVNISSRGAAPIPGPPFPKRKVGAQSLYGSTKAMLDRLTTAAAMDLYEDGVAVNTLAPTAPVLTENARVHAGLDESIRHEPLETVAEAALALATCDLASCTGRVAYSLPLLVEFNRPVFTVDGMSLLEGWQRDEIDPALLWPGYLALRHPAT